MKATMPWIAAVLCATGLAAEARAQCYGCSPALQRPLLQAPDACGPGFYYIDRCGTIYGPNYCLYPPYPPFQGWVRPCPPGPGGLGMPGQMGTPSFPSHPHARSPRDFFMWTEAQAERHTRERRLPLVP